MPYILYKKKECDQHVKAIFTQVNIMLQTKRKAERQERELTCRYVSAHSRFYVAS